MRSDRRGKGYHLRGVVALTILLVIGVTPSFAQLEGVWESVERGDSGVGMAYDFRPDGILCTSPGAMFDFVYQFVGGRVLVLSADLSEDPETVMAFRLENDQLVVDVGEAAPPLVRVDEGDPEAGPVVGTWKYIDTDESDEALGGTEAAVVRRNTRIRLTSTGKALLRIPFSVDCSAYQVDGSTLTMERSGETITPTFRVEGDMLFLTSRTGTEAAFSRLAE